jgi:predicted protein tyrosine phosphatase
MPPVFRGAFKAVLRLGFTDMLSTEPRLHGQRPPSIRDARRVVRFVERTAADSVGYAVHCWSGISRSTAVALGMLFMLRGDEGAALRELLAVRPYAKPHPELLAHFDALLGSRLASTAAAMGPARIEALRRRIRKAAGRDPGTNIDQ